MVSSKDNKIVDYGGTALGVGSVMLCFAFYPALIFASEVGRWFAEHILSLFIEYIDQGDVVVTQVFFFAMGIGFISGLFEVAKEFKICYVFLIIIYVVTFMPAWRLLLWCYE